MYNANRRGEAARQPRAAASGARTRSPTPTLTPTRDGEPFSVGGFTVRDRKIVAIYILADPARLRQFNLLAVLDD